MAGSLLPFWHLGNVLIFPVGFTGIASGNTGRNNNAAFNFARRLQNLDNDWTGSFRAMGNLRPMM
jgi:hypothetical protein